MCTYHGQYLTQLHCLLCYFHDSPSISCYGGLFYLLDVISKRTLSLFIVLQPVQPLQAIHYNIGHRQLTGFKFVWFVIDLEVILYGQTTISWDFGGSIDDYFNP